MKFTLFSEIAGDLVAVLSFVQIDVEKKRRDITCTVEEILPITDPNTSAYVSERLKDGVVIFTLRSDYSWRMVNSSYLRLMAVDSESSKYIEEILQKVRSENRKKKKARKLNPKFDLMPGRRYVAIDVETTGLRPFSGDRIIQLAAIDVTDFVHSNGENDESASRIVTKFNPQMPIPAEASAVNRIYDNAVVDAPLFGEYAQVLTEFIGDAILIGHNVKFDIDCVNSELDRLGKPRLSNDSYCTLKNARNKLGDGLGYRGPFNLEAVRLYLDIPSQGAWHDALSDAKVAARLFNALVKIGSESSQDGGAEENSAITDKSQIVTISPAENFSSNPNEQSESYRVNPSCEFVQGKRYVAICIETTGPYPFSGDRIIDFAALDVTELLNRTDVAEVRVSGRATKLNPGMAIPAEVSESIGIHNRDLLQAPQFSDHAEELIEFIGDAILIGHNMKLCLDFINSELARIEKKPLTNAFFCTQTNAMIKLGRQGYGGGYQLGELIDFFGIESTSPTHDAASKAMLIPRLFNVLTRFDLINKLTAIRTNHNHPSESGTEAKNTNHYFLAVLAVLFVGLVLFAVIIEKT